MEIPYKLTEDDHARAAILARFGSRRLHLIVFLLLTGIFLFTAILNDYMAPFPFVLVGVCGPLYLYIYVLTPRRVRLNIRKSKRVERDVYLSMNEEGLSFRSEASFGVFEWREVYRWTEDRDYILLFDGPAYSIVIPKRLSELGLDLNLLRQKLREHVGRPT